MLHGTVPNVQVTAVQYVLTEDPSSMPLLHFPVDDSFVGSGAARARHRAE